MENIDLVLIIVMILLIYFFTNNSNCENMTVGQDGIKYGGVPLQFVTSMSDPKYYYTSQQDGTLFVPDSCALI